MKPRLKILDVLTEQKVGSFQIYRRNAHWSYNMSVHWSGFNECKCATSGSQVNQEYKSVGVELRQKLTNRVKGVGKANARAARP